MPRTVTVERLGSPDQGESPGILSHPEPRVLPKATVRLYVNHAPVSRLAFEMLDQAGVLVEVIAASRKRQPEAHWGPLWFRGLDEVKVLSEMLIEFRNRVVAEAREHLPQLFEVSAPVEHERVRERIRATARARIEELVGA